MEHFSRIWEFTKSRLKSELPLLVTVLLWSTYFALIWFWLFSFNDGALYTSLSSTWGDWSLHFSFNRAFAFREWGALFDQHPVFYDFPWRYHFLSNFFSGMLERLGFAMLPAAIIPQFIASMLLTPLLYYFFRTQNISSTFSAIGTAAFYCMGGLKFFSSLWSTHPDVSLFTLLSPERFLSLYSDDRYKFGTSVSSQLLPQRAFLLGMCMALTSMIFAIHLRNRKPKHVYVALVGVNLGLTALGQVYAAAIAFLFMLLLLLPDPRQQKPLLKFCMVYLVIVLLCFFVFFFQWVPSPYATHSIVSWFPGFYSNPSLTDPPNWFAFWWRHWGFLWIFLLTPILIKKKSLYKSPSFVCGVILFVSANLFKIAPWIWDNTKVLTWSYLFFLVIAMQTAQVSIKKFGVFGKVFTFSGLLLLCISGAHELILIAGQSSKSFVMYSAQDFSIAEKFREISRAEDLVLCDSDHHHWVAPLSGRQILMGYPGWLWSSGIEYLQREDDLKQMFALSKIGKTLMQNFGVKFIVVGPRERQRYELSNSDFDREFETVLKYADTTIYKTNF